MSNKFKTPESNPLLNPIDWFNFFGSFISIFDGVKDIKSLTDSEAVFVDGLEPNNNKPTFILKNGIVEVAKSNLFDIAIGCKISKFMLLTAIRFKGDYFAAMSFVEFTLMKSEIPYIRVGTDYYKVIKKEDRYGSLNIMLKPWKKDEIKQDHTKQLLSRIFKFEDFTIIPNNKTFIPVKHNCYNLYAKFPHEPHTSDVTLDEIPTTKGLLIHVFGEQVQLGLKYMKLLYENPMQILPVLALVSTERETGKTTFLNWISMLFGENSVLIAPTDLTSNFNSGYATKNIIMIDETVIEKSTSTEKLKSLATAKSISIQQKFVQQYSVPFFGKIIICTNKEKDFMRIDEEEIRFWIRKIKPIEGKKNVNIENDLFNEIPKFLKFLTMMPEIDLTNSRMVFTKEEINTSYLAEIKEESKSQLRKELEILLEDFFQNNSEEFFATASDIKSRWFNHNNQVSIAYLRKVLKDEMKLNLSEPTKYIPFNDTSILSKTGRVFHFKSEIHYEFENQIDESESNKIPF